MGRPESVQASWSQARAILHNSHISVNIMYVRSSSVEAFFKITLINFIRPKIQECLKIKMIQSVCQFWELQYSSFRWWVGGPPPSLTLQRLLDDALYQFYNLTPTLFLFKGLLIAIVCSLDIRILSLFYHS